MTEVTLSMISEDEEYLTFRDIVAKAAGGESDAIQGVIRIFIGMGCVTRFQ